MRATHDGDVDLTTVQSVPSQGRATQSTEEADTTGYRLEELSHMLSKGELPVVPDIQENREGFAEHSHSINGDVWLPGPICTDKAEGGCLAFECFQCQSRLIRQNDHYAYFLLKDATTKSLLRALRTINRSKA